ncbi:tyrosine-protein phosphatase [Rhodococcus triatomae]|uniref:Protein-tyrosine phosphatase n=1 Tax=Rhodococcus triatomae TaxID=300028 RepID=A0A1G8A5P2_9NOCA|nr:tyrosine-protein phosphatase [Rhodococcus triatomae]QNG17852.1 tyrosine-protein phosphatase [Rhodococcus triatomae]QNG22480.1 tyrosine-protein phosphatase [Rhodococcus triatomae]SDH16193.1 protein-tyrosine phosphatase [Rhodococcus triatomae]
MNRTRTTLAAAVVTSALLGAVTTGVAQAQPPAPPLPPVLDLGSLSFGSLGIPAPDAPRLASVPNFRDVAGTGSGYVGHGGTHLNKGVLYRADTIVPDDADLAALERLGLAAVYDLRADDEVAEKPDRLPAGVEYVRIPILSGNIADMIDQIGSVEDSRNMMRDMNRAFVAGDAERAGFTRLLTELAQNDGRQVFHCTAGKDRTGWTSMLLLSLAGVDRATIVQDYLLTNEYNREWAAKTRAHIAATQGEEAAILFEPLLGVEDSYLQAGLDEIDARYGSVDAYLTEGLGLSTDTLDALRHKLLG